jgi:hypothetical protein
MPALGFLAGHPVVRAAMRRFQRRPWDARADEIWPRFFCRHRPNSIGRGVDGPLGCGTLFDPSDRSNPVFEVAL